MTMPPSPRSPQETTRDREVAEMLLPPMRRRLHDILLFLAIFQTLYTVALVIAPDDLWRIRLALNLSRLLVLFGSIGLLRRPGSDRQTLAIAATAIGTQLFVGGAVSVVRGDAMPAAILAVALNAVTSAIVPWNAGTQFAIAVATVTGLHATSHFVRVTGGIPLSFDSLVTAWATIGFTVWLSRFLERTRATLSVRLDEARRTDEELAALHRDLERRVAERTAELEMANRELEGFSYTVSHDLRSPLRTIAGFSQMILDESGASLDEAARDHLSKIRAASCRMDDLIDDMLLLARVGRSALRYETVETAKLAASIGAQIAAEEPDRRVEFTVGGIPPVPADHGLLKIALDNLLRNAWKFTSGGEAARVTVSGERHGDGVRIRVEDNGVGFDPRFRHKLFLPFQRLHDHADFPGTGVGLATVARIVRRHGGEVDASSDGRNGAVFTLTLPAKRPSQGAYLAASTSSTEATTAAATVATCSSVRS